MKQFILNYLWFLVNWKLRSNPQIIGITGTAGKTSTKIAISTVLGEKYKIVYTKGNLNTEFGVPYVLLDQSMPTTQLKWFLLIIKSFFSALIPISKDTLIILELGADRPNDISFFTKRLKINYAVITNIGNAHLMNYDSIYQLISEKMQLMRAVKDDGYLIYNNDDSNLIEQVKLFPQERKFSYGSVGDCKISNFKYNLTGIKATLSSHDNEYNLQLAGFNKTLFWSLAPAVILGNLFNLNHKQIDSGLRKYIIENGRGKILTGIKNSTLIDHTYNSNPISLSGVIDSIDKLPKTKRKIAVLGDMKELGDASKSEHQKIGKLAKSVFNKVYTYGTEAREFGGENFNTQNELSAVLLKEIREGDIILIMGSQASRLEKVLIKLLNSPETSDQVLVRQSEYWKKQ